MDYREYCEQILQGYDDRWIFTHYRDSVKLLQKSFSVWSKEEAIQIIDFMIEYYQSECDANSVDHVVAYLSLLVGATTLLVTTAQLKEGQPFPPAIIVLLWCIFIPDIISIGVMAWKTHNNRRYKTMIQILKEVRISL